MSLLIVCFVLGLAVQRFAEPPAGMAQSLNWYVLNIAFSALVLHLVPTLRFDTDLWFLVVSMWLVFLGAWGVFEVIGRRLQWSRRRIGALILICGLGNTSFIGFPLVEALRGKEGLQLALIADQAGCFIALAVGGTIVAALYSGGRVHPAVIVRKVVVFPPFVAVITGIAIALLGGLPAAIDGMLERIGATLVPLALFSVGLQFRLRIERGQAAAIALGLSWKLVLAPVCVYIAGRSFGVDGLVLIVAVLEAAMAPMISAAILAEQNDLEPRLATTMLSIGIVLSLITVPFIDRLLS